MLPQCVRWFQNDRCIKGMLQLIRYILDETFSVCRKPMPNVQMQLQSKQKIISKLQTLFTVLMRSSFSCSDSAVAISMMARFSQLQFTNKYWKMFGFRRGGSNEETTRWTVTFYFYSTFSAFSFSTFFSKFQTDFQQTLEMRKKIELRLLTFYATLLDFTYFEENNF